MLLQIGDFLNCLQDKNHSCLPNKTNDGKKLSEGEIMEIRKGKDPKSDLQTFNKIALHFGRW